MSITFIDKQEAEEYAKQKEEEGFGTSLFQVSKLPPKWEVLVYQFKTGKPLIKKDAVRVGEEGIFYSDLPVEDITRFSKTKKKIIKKDIEFNNPIVYSSQWEAIEKILGEEEYQKARRKFLRIPDEKLMDFFNKYDKIIAGYAIDKGHDGIIYTHGSEEGGNIEYMDLKNYKKQ